MAAEPRGAEEGHPVFSIEQLLTESSLRDYIAVLSRRLAPQLVVTQLGHLSLAISVMTPTADRTLIKLAVARLT